MPLRFVRLLIIIFVSGVWLLAQAPDYTLKVDVPYVSVDLTVEDQNRIKNDDLSAESFELYEDGVRQDIRYFSPVSTPYNIYLLFDRSGSTQDKWALMQRAVAGFIANLRPQDHIAIASFDSELKRQLSWTNDRHKALLALPELIRAEKIGGTDFYGAMEQTLRNEFKKTKGRRALIVLTDGRDTSIYKELMVASRLLEPEEDRQYQRVLKAARNERVPIYVVAFNTDRNLEANTIGADEYVRLQIIFPKTAIPDRYLAGVRRRMEGLAEISGGRILYPKKFEEIVPLYQQIARDIGTSYTLGYVSTNPSKNSGFRQIEVKTKDPALRVIQSRNGYYAK